MDAGALVIGRVSNVVADYLSDGSEDEAGSSKEKSGEASNAPEASLSEESSKETGHTVNLTKILSGLFLTSPNLYFLFCK